MEREIVRLLCYTVVLCRRANRIYASWDEELRALRQEALEDLVAVQRKIFARMGAT